MAKAPLSLTPASASPFGRPPRRRRRDAAPAPGWRAWRLALLGRLGAPDWSRVALVVVTVLALSAPLSLHLLPDKVSLRDGAVSDHVIRAQRAARYVDEDATQSLRAAAAARVLPLYEPVRYAAADADRTIADIYKRLRQDQALGNQNPLRAAGELHQEVGVVVSPPALLAPLLKDAASAYHLDQAEQITRRAVDQAMDAELRDDHSDDIQRARAFVAAQVAASPLPRAYVPAVAALARDVVRPTLMLNRARTEAAREHESLLVPPQYGQVFAGDIIVRAGEPVTPTTINKFRALGLQNPRLSPSVVASVTLLIALMVAVVGVYLARYHAAVYASTKTLVLLSLLSALSVLGVKLGGTMLGVRLSEAQFGYVGMLGVAASAMLIAALIHPRVAVLIAALLAAQSGLTLGGDLRFTLMTLLSSLVAVYAVSDIRSRSDVLRAGAILCATDVALSVIVGRIEGDLPADVVQAMLWAGLSGVIAVALFSLGAALFERPFGVTTHLGLLELSDPNRPLLREFCLRAPGTYTHSVMVGNLAVAAAEAVGADALLCRVGAYYHDLGKMRRAEFFIENQHGENVHERLNPSLSALVVTAHVKDGLEIAEQERLPPVVKAFITEHHGTSLIKYFYHQQCEGGEAAPGLEQHFRYAGPKPQSRETAILMLADGVEAASRTLEKPTPGRIGDLVDKIIQAQLADGQLDESDVTLRDLRGIRDAFVRLLSGMLHSRIEYPDLLKTDKHGTADSAADAALAAPGTACDPDHAAPNPAAA